VETRIFQNPENKLQMRYTIMYMIDIVQDNATPSST